MYYLKSGCMKDSHKVIMSFRHLYSIFFKPKVLPAPPREMNKAVIQKIIYDKIIEGKPLMIARFGSIECDVCENVRYTYYKKRSNLRFICWHGQPNFINPYVVPLFSKNAGFFPSDDHNALRQFYELMVDCMPDVDVLQSWCYNERFFADELKNAIKVDREISTPLLTKKPWTLALKGKKVLVVHPFAETIKSQYARIDKVFPNDVILPEFDLKVLKAVQTAGGNKTKFKTWFDALQYMEDEIDKIDYDICLLGCGAYGFPLASHIKRKGKQAIHLGGGLQLLFGIKGRRWETVSEYLDQFPYAKTYYNEYWVRPSADETPINAEGVEGSCYW